MGAKNEDVQAQGKFIAQGLQDLDYTFPVRHKSGRPWLLGFMDGDFWRLMCRGCRGIVVGDECFLSGKLSGMSSHCRSFVLLIFLLYLCPQIQGQSLEMFMASGPILLSRSEWQAEKPALNIMVPQKNIRSVVIHHSEGRAPVSKEESFVVKNIQNYHMSEKHWGDIAYHFMIAPSGNIYEGRPVDFAGDSGTRYDLQGRVLICVMGSYSKEPPTQAALQALKNLVISQCKKFGLKFDQSCCHRDLAETECPGDAFYKWFKEQQWSW